MNALSIIVEAFSRWIDSVAATAVSIFERFGSRQHVQFVEGERDVFTLRAPHSVLPDQQVRIANGSIVGTLPADWTATLQGCRAELIMQSSRFLFRPLELPKRAVEYLEGIVRSQIDRLTPWPANDAVYGWTPPVDAKNDRISLVIAATARGMITPYLQPIGQLGAASIVFSTVPLNSDSETAPIKFFEQRMRTRVDVARVRSILVAVFLLSGLSAGISIGASVIIANNLDTEQQELLRKISARNTAIRSGLDPAAGSAQQMLERRKQTTPSSVIALEALSALLPDDTYVTELRIDGEKLQIVGITRNAPTLIRLIEQSPHFARATFFAPTTQSSGETRERFHIEAVIKPIFTLGT